MKMITAFVKFVVVLISSIIMSAGLQSCEEELGDDVFDASVLEQAYLDVPKGVDVSGTKWSEFANIEED